MKKTLALFGILLIGAGIVGWLTPPQRLLRAFHHGLNTKKMPPGNPPDNRGIVLEPGDKNAHPGQIHHDSSLAQIAAAGANWIEVSLELRATDGFDIAALTDVTRLAHEHALKVCLVLRLPLSERAYLPAQETQQNQWMQRVWSPPVLAAVQAAEPLGIDMICLGDRLGDVQERTMAWESLIAAVRKIYKGSLTYAADSDSYAYISWWSSLDYVGVVGDFSLSDDSDPTTDAMSSALDAQLATLESISSIYGKPALLLDVGYSTNPQVAHDPTLTDSPGSARPDIQEMCYQSALDATRGKTWLAGLFIKPSSAANKSDPTNSILPPLREMLARQWK